LRPSETVLERRFLSNDAEENKFSFIEITVLDAAGGNKCLDGS
jgi:hypothetical protein